MADLRVTLIGCGGIGTHLADAIARFLHFYDGVHVLTLVDGDAFEEKNGSRQSFDALGNKAEVVRRRLAHRYPRVRVQAVKEYITPANEEFILFEGDIVLLAVDNHKTRKLVSDAAASIQTISIISGGNEYHDGSVQVYLRRDGQDLTPPLTDGHPEIANPVDKSPHEMTCVELAQAGSPQVLFANLMAAVMMGSIFWRLVTKPETFLQDQQGSGEYMLDTAYTEVYFDIQTLAARAYKRPVQSHVTQPPQETETHGH